MKPSRFLHAWQNLLIGWIAVHASALTVAKPARAADALDTFRTIGVYSIVDKGHALAPDFSEFLAGYLDNVKNYKVHNLNEHDLQQRFVFNRDNARTEVLQKAAGLGADAVLLARLKGFREHEIGGEAKLRLFEVRSGEEIRTWSAPVAPPYFDPPTYLHIQPYGNLDEVFAEFPLATYEAPLEIRLLVVSDQRLRGRDRHTRDYLISQLDLTSRVLEREFGIKLVVERIERWKPPDTDIASIARAAAGIAGREEVDLTFVCLGPPAPATYWSGPTALGYARVLTNVVVNKVMNAHVFVHEIGHVLGAIHVDQAWCIMQPMLARHTLAERFEILPHIQFGELNKRIINTAKTLPLGRDYQHLQDKIESLVSIYEEVSTEHPAKVAPYYADLLVNLDQLDKALALLQVALEANPFGAGIRLRLVEVLYRMGRDKQAQQLVQADFDLRKAGLNEWSGGRVELADFASIKISASLLLFGELAVHRQKTTSFTVSNLGTKTLEISRINPPKQPFSLVKDTPQSATIEPGESLKIEVMFRPKSAGPHHGTLEILSNARGTE
jgi:tetratricopeptide (TPR) repeat protein